METFLELKEECKLKNKKIYELCQEYESYIAEISVKEVRKKVEDIIFAMKSAIKRGLVSFEMSASGLSGGDCYKLAEKYGAKGSLFGPLYEKITTYALSVIEENARMGKIVACPTAGSCGIVPAVLVAVSEFLDIDKGKQIDALITSGMVGELVSRKMALAGAVAGCQAECGVASAMASALLCTLLDCDIDTIFNAVALCLKNIQGLTCDPVGGLVEVPCVKRNVFLAIHSVTAYELATSGIESKIPLDEVVDSLKQTGQLMSPLLKESSQGGLATTKTALEKLKLFD